MEFAPSVGLAIVRCRVSNEQDAPKADEEEVEVKGANLRGPWWFRRSRELSSDQRHDLLAQVFFDVGDLDDALERTAMLTLIDERWTDHLRSLDEVKEGIGLRAYGQRDPLVEYKMEAFRLFKEVLEQISRDVVSFVFRAGPLVEKKQATASTRRRGTAYGTSAS